MDLLCVMFRLCFAYFFFFFHFLLFFLFFFFFQAEDGIRDLYVTGVQTCALPISRGQVVGPEGQRQQLGERRRRAHARVVDEVDGRVRRGELPQPLAAAAAGRSEERRVGKECRSRWSPYQ